MTADERRSRIIRRPDLTIDQKAEMCAALIGKGPECAKKMASRARGVLRRHYGDDSEAAHKKYIKGDL